VRERQLIGFVAQGRKNKDIARLMGISEGTVKVYLSRLFPKVGAQDRLSLALMGLRNVRSSQQNSLDKIGPASTSRLVPLAIPQFLSTESVAA
jgi:DNA-binding NarL/FixJ family response regulator